MSSAGWIWLGACAVVVVAANVALRAAVDRSGVVLFSSGLSGLPREVLALVLNPITVLAVLLYGLAIAIWLRLLGTEPLSIAYPSLASTTFIAITAAGVLVYGEPWSVAKSLGAGLMLAGLLVMATN